MPREINHMPTIFSVNIMFVHEQNAISTNNSFLAVNLLSLGLWICFGYLLCLTALLVPCLYSVQFLFLLGPLLNVYFLPPEFNTYDYGD